MGQARALRTGRICAAAIVFALAAAAATAAPAGAARPGRDKVDPALYGAAQASPGASFRVIVQGSNAAADLTRLGAGARQLRSIGAAAATVTGSQLVALAGESDVAAVAPDAPVQLTGAADGSMWRQTIDLSTGPGGPRQHGPGAPAQLPAVAVVDSGIADLRETFGNRVLAHVNLSSLSPGATGDQMGHGTMVAGILGGGARNYPGVAPTVPLVDVRVTDGVGHAYTSDVIAGCDWILAHKGQYGIRVANLSLVGDTPTSFRFDPLDKAVEQLWLNGIVVVTAAGNGGTAGAPVDMSFSPGNDPFVITVGATDQMGTPTTADDTLAPWSAFGSTNDGFSKPDLAAPGRYIVGPVPALSYLQLRATSHTVAPGYVWMSGTSFATPMVAGAAALLLGEHPSWTPDQVKGALISTANPLPLAGASAGAGELDVANALALTTAPNANENLDTFVTGGAFDADAWATYVSANSNWTSSNWTSSNWTSSNWTSSNWTSSNWTSSNWTSSNWTSSNWVE